MKKIIFGAIALTVLFAAACDDTKTSMFDCDTTPTYTDDVKAIIDASCATSGCHDATTMADGKNYTTFALVEAESKKTGFIESVQRVGDFTPMPLGGDKLSDAKIETLTCWVEGGSPE